MAEGSSGGGGESSSKIPFIPLSPPKCEVDDTPLHGKSLNKNKESLKVKLMLRRPRHDLISRGVLPAVSTSYNFYEQRQKLDMAKKHDILKHKMQRRPLREELVRQHILEDSPNNFAPALVEKHKQLKRARIADTINDHLCQRPGPLELVKANILHTSEDLEKAVKEGQLVFKSTSEGEPRKHPSFYLLQEDESSSGGGLSPDQSEGGSGGPSRESSMTPVGVPLSVSGPTLAGSTILASPQQLIISAARSSFGSLTSVGTSLASVTPLQATTLPSGVTILATSNDVNGAQSPLTSNTSSMSPLSSLASPAHHVIPSPQAPTLAQTLFVAQTPLPHALTTPPLQNSAPGKDQSKSRKKSKGKSQPKARTIKFHEYKGPPSAAKKDHSSTPIETSYDILLQQQNLFLQCQLELKQKYTQILFPAGIKPTCEVSPNGVTLSSVLTLAPSSSHSTTSHTPIAPAPSTVPPAPPPPPNKIPSFRLPTKLEELKVSDLKAELKKRNLPVSGSKPNLIERLKLHTKSSATTSTTSVVTKTIESFDGDGDLSTNLFTPLSSIDLAEDASVSGILEASMEVGGDSIASPTYSQISTRPPSAAPMDVDFDLSMDVAYPQTPSSAFFDDAGSITTPPPPPPPPPPLPTYVRRGGIRVVQPAKQFMSPSEAAEKPQEGIQQLQQKIEDLQKQLRDTQMQLQHQQQQNMLKAQELYKRSSSDAKLSQRDILQQQLDSRKQLQQQRQLQSHMEQLQQNLKKEQKQLAKNVHEDSKFDSLEELLHFHATNKEPTPAVQEHPYQQQYALITEQLPDNSLRIQQPVSTQQAYRVSDIQTTKGEGEWIKSIPSVTVSSPAKVHRPSSAAESNGFLTNAHHRQVGITSSLPNFSRTCYSQESTNALPNMDLGSFDAPSQVSESHGVLKAPPNYSEATKILNDCNQDIYGASYKNQQVDDVIEILIKNGELSPSAVGVFPMQMAPHPGNIIAHVEIDSRKQVPPTPPPPPPIKQGRVASAIGTTTFPVAASSPSLFADLIMGSNSPADVSLDLDLPVFNGIELSHLETNDPPTDRRRESSNLPDIKMEMGQDLDVASWINSLTSAPSVSFAQPSATASWISLVASNPSQNKQKNVVNSLRSGSSASSSSGGYGSTLHQSDPLLGSNAEQLDFFSIDDIDLKTPSQSVHDLSWEGLDFTT